MASRSATVRDLSRRLLLTTARAPQGLGDSTELLRQRVSLLWAAGWAGDATALLRVVPPVAEHPALDASIATVNNNGVVLISLGVFFIFDSVGGWKLSSG